MRDRQEREAGGGGAPSAKCLAAIGVFLGLSLAAGATPLLQVLSPWDSNSQGAPETACGLGRKYFERQKKHIKMFNQQQGIKKAAQLLFWGFFK